MLEKHLSTFPHPWNRRPRCPIQHKAWRNPLSAHIKLDLRKPIGTQNGIPPSDASPTTVALDLSRKLNGSSVALRTLATAVWLPRIHSSVANICDRPTAWFGSPSCTAASLGSSSVRTRVSRTSPRESKVSGQVKIQSVPD